MEQYIQDVRNSQIPQNLYSSTSPMPTNNYYGSPAYEPSYQNTNVPQTFRGGQVTQRDPYYTQDQVIESQGFKVAGKDIQLSPIKKVQNYQQSPTNNRVDYSSTYPVTYQTNVAINQRYYEQSPKSKQNGLIDTHSLENSTKNQPQIHGFYQDQMKVMNDQQKQLFYLNESPFQSVTYTPSKYNSNHISVQNSIGLQKPIYIGQQNEISHIRQISPVSQANKGLFSAKSLSEEEKQSPIFNQENHKENVQDERINKLENKQMYNSIHRNVSQIVDKYFKQINKQQQQPQTEKLESQSMHQFSNHKNEQLSKNRFNTQTAERNWSPLLSAQRQQNNSNSSIFSQPFDVGVDAQKTISQNQLPSSPSYAQYISSDTEKILQKWNKIHQGQTLNQKDKQNTQAHKYFSEQNVKQTKMQQHYESQLQNKQQFNPIQQNILTQEINKSDVKNTNGIQNLSSIQNIPSQQIILQNSQNSIKDQSYTQLNHGFVQTKQQISLQGIPNQNTINNLSNIEKQTRNELDDSESKKLLQNAKLSSFDDFEKFDNYNSSQFTTNNDNIIYDSNELFDVKNIKNKNINNNMKEYSEVFSSLKSNNDNEILTPSIVNLPKYETSKRKISTDSADSNQEFSLKQILNLPKTIKKTLRKQKEPKKKQKNKSLLIFQVVSCLLILIFFYILLFK